MPPSTGFVHHSRVLIKAIILFPFKAVYFIWRWIWYVVLFPLGIISLI